MLMNKETTDNKKQEHQQKIKISLDYTNFFISKQKAYHEKYDY